MSLTHFIEFTYIEKLLSFLYNQFSYIRKSYVQLFLDIGAGIPGYRLLGLLVLLDPSNWYLSNRNVPHTWSDTKWVERTIITEPAFLSQLGDTYICEYVRISFLRYVRTI